VLQALNRAAPKEPAGAPRLAADPLRRRLFFLFKLLSGFPFSSSSIQYIYLVFLCTVVRFAYSGEPAGERRRLLQRAAAATVQAAASFCLQSIPAARSEPTAQISPSPRVKQKGTGQTRVAPAILLKSP
jgi:hypothetical protein